MMDIPTGCYDGDRSFILSQPPRATFPGADHRRHAAGRTADLPAGRAQPWAAKAFEQSACIFPFWFSTVNILQGGVLQNFK